MKKTSKFLKHVAYVTSVIAFVVAPILNTVQASAAQITARKVVLGSSAPSASTTYAVTFTVPTTATIVKSVSMVPCTTASGSCTTPTGFSGTGATSSQPSSAGLGDTTGWATTDSTSTELRLSKTGNVATPTSTPVTVTFSSVTNPSALNSTFFLRITTFSTATWTTAIDTGTVATSTAGQITVNATVDEALSFTLTAATVNLSPTPVTTAATSFGTSTMSASTNATTGYSITVSGTTLTSGANTITALSSPTASSTNTSQFGLNLMANTTPSVGSGVSGGGSGAAATGYNTANQFKFASGDTVASASVPTNSNSYTVSYIANIDGVQKPGSYTTVLTYVATPNF